ncbi:SfnB family sulfur acquisition oxidoreductase [Rhodococcoides corynebacterioides]|uniref:Dibenzothiophene monooxygenase n=1 Tax=Rhodococcoides corynebacterioides TaxID=53972 RepID=A0ABS7P215_9NOCA|nr:SfnB family sulfur acquisition oxidoreductase [Rhodococcus corynebacterioides]MBY6366438.1 SfnB family sulfur acquisition oxidoreductase [Rhodococcus corynebacterioides]MBY6407038.1 SfnB family sulfur acquisition oxidoreductase [Rhodococcus corynebacterioides]
MTPPLLDDDAAIAAAESLRPVIAAGAAARDRDRILPRAELDALSQSGLLGITVPARFGGRPVATATVARVVATLARGDASVAQIPQSHLTFLDALRRTGTDLQQKRWFGEALSGRRFANAQSERGTPTVGIDHTSFVPRSDGSYRLNGRKYYCTGALLAHWLVVRGVVGDHRASDAQRRKVLAYLPVDTPGIVVEDDWDGLGQRTTASGTVVLSDVDVPADALIPYSAIFTEASTYGARAQLVHAAIDVGIARAAIDAARTAVAGARPPVDAGVETADRDPLLLQQFGDLEITVRSAEALLVEAGRAIDRAEDPRAEGPGTTDPEVAAAASIAVAAAKVVATRAALDTTASLFDAGGTRSAAASSGTDRLWRDARTHTLHDPSRWKVQHVGRYALTGAHPPRHGLV